MADYQERLAAAREAMDAALATYKRERAALLREDGGPKFSEAEQAARLAALNETLHSAADKAIAVADAELTELNRLAEAEGDDPTARLSAGELAVAASRWLFVKEDVAGMSLPELVTRVRGVLAAGGAAPDRVSALLWSRAARQRWRTGRQAAAAAGRTFPDRVERDDWSNLDGLLGRLEAVLAPAGTIAPPLAERQRAASVELKGYVQGRVSEADGTLGALVQRTAAEYRAAF